MTNNNPQRFLVAYAADNDEERNKFLAVIGDDETRRYKSKKWSISEDTLALLKNIIPAANFLAEPEYIVGQDLKYGLYNYQKKIVEYGLDKGHAIIVSPCGSGKTPSLLSLYTDLKRTGKMSEWAQGLLVVKASLKVQWGHEIEKFSDLTYNILDTYKSVTAKFQAKIKDRKKKLDEAFNRLDDEAILTLSEEIEALEKEADEAFYAQFDSKYNLLVANYETLRDPMVRKALHKAKLEFVGADEIHMIKSDTSERAKALHEFNNLSFRFGATATPIAKSPEDAFSISKLISPSTFERKGYFRDRYLKIGNYNKAIGSKNEEELHQKLSDFMIVISKEEVFSQLPEVTVVTRYCDLTKNQQDMTEKLLAEIAELKEQENTIMRRTAGNPQGDAKEEMLKIEANILARQTFASELADSEELLMLSDSDMAKKYCTKSKSNKIELLLDLMEEIFDSGEKVAIFSKYRKMQDILTKEIKARFEGIDIAYVNGELSSEKRYVEVYDKFKDKPECKVLLLSDAGAEGRRLCPRKIS